MTQTRQFFDTSRLPVVYHPGETLEEKLQEMGMSVKEFATRVSKPEKTVIAVLKGKSSITPDMAIAFELVTKIPAHMWLNLQKNFDEYVARRHRAETLKEDLAWARKFPISELLTLGWISSESDLDSYDIVISLCSFFAVSSPKGWADFYLNQRLRVAFRITLVESCDPYALSAWLRRGEIQASEQQVNASYSSKMLRSLLSEITAVDISFVEKGRQQLTALLNQAGVKLVFTETLSSAPVKGCTRYICGFPCIQLAKSFDSDADFWHTLLHEVGHILLHGKKEIFIENIEYGDKDPIKERDADEFASAWMKRRDIPSRG